VSHEPLLRHVLCTGPVCCPTDRQACLFVIFINLYWNLLKGFVICQSLCCIYLSYYKQSSKLLMIFKYFPWALAQDKYSPQARAVGIYDDSGSNFWLREHDESRRAICHTIVICSCLHCVSKKRHPFTRLSVSHGWYQLLSESWVCTRVWCLWTPAWRLMAATTMTNCCGRGRESLTIQFGHFCCLFIGKVELSCCKVKCVHMKQVWWWYTKYTFSYHLCKVCFR